MSARLHDQLGSRGGRPPPGGDAAGRIRTHALGRRGARSAGKGGRGRPSRVLALLLAITLLWAGAATWLAISGRNAASRLAEEGAELKQHYEERTKALTRRLVGVASHGMLEQEGLSGRLADIIARQVELENRQSALILMTDKIAGAGQASAAPPSAGAVPLARGRAEEDGRAAGVRPQPVQPAPAPKTDNPGRPAPATPTLRLGAPAPGDPAPASLGPRSSLEPLATPQPQSPAGARSLQGMEALPVREQFSRLEASLNRLGGSQIRYLGALAAGAQNGIALIRASLATLGVSVQPGAVAEPKGRRPAGRLASVDAFETQLAETEASLGQLERWRGVVELVPVRPPVDAETTPTSNFGTRKDPFTGASATHAGIDFRGALGTPVKAAAAGRVITADVSGGYGNLVEIEHGNGIVTRYAHLSGFSVTAGQPVAAGTVVGLLGSTGRSTGPHLHYETRIDGSAVDPMRFLQAGAQIFDHPPPIAASLQADEEASFD